MMILGFMLAMALYHMFLYAFTAKELAYIIYSIFMMLIVTRFVTIPGGIAEIIAPGHTDIIFHISEVALILFCIFGMWFSHETLRLKWGGLPTRIIYILTLGLPLILAAGTGKAAGTWWFMLAQTPHFFIITKGILSKSCRANPYALLYIGAEALLMAMPVIMLILPLPPLYMPYIPFWLFFMLVQALLLSQSYGEAKRRERELTEEKRLLEKLNHTKSEFFGNISHEIKTPLTIIVTDMELAGELIDEGNLDSAKELIHEACQKTMQTADIVTDALAFARGQEIAKTMEHFDFGAVIEATLAIFEPLIKKQGNVLKRDIARLPQIKGNANMLADVLVNLLFNANRHTENGIIYVRWTANNGQLFLSINDNGSGISPEILPRVFERGTTGGTGTGLGLAIVESVMKLHGGQVRIESEVGEGTSVTLTFPALMEECI